MEKMIIKGAMMDISEKYRVQLEELTDKTVKRCKPESMGGCNQLLPIDRYIKRRKENQYGEVYYAIESWCKSCQRQRDRVKSRNYRNRFKNGTWRMEYDGKLWMILKDDVMVKTARFERDAKDMLIDLKFGSGEMFNVFFTLPAPPLKWCREAQDLVPR